MPTTKCSILFDSPITYNIKYASTHLVIIGIHRVNNGTKHADHTVL